MKKRFLALALSAVMIVSLAACGKKEENESTTQGNTTTTAATEQTDKSDNGGEPAVEASYTYNDYNPGSPKTWNPHEWETEDDAYIMNYTQMGLYNFYLNEERDGYVIRPEMAAEEPEDITKDYAGNEIYGVPADATEGYAFRIKLNQNACWEDGVKITSEDYIYSMEQQLSPDMANYRASSYYSGETGLANAFDYYNNKKAGQTKYSSLADMGYASVEEAQTAKAGELYLDMNAFWNLGLEDGKNLVPITDETEYRDEAIEEGADEDYVSAKYLYDKYLAPGMANEGDAVAVIFAEDGVYEEVPFENVGILAEDEYTIILVLEKPVTEFYLYYGLSGNWIVRKDLYEANKKQTGDITKTTYGTSKDNYMSYGPYKLTEFQVDKQITMVKNDKWYGYTDGKHEGLFQTTKINTQIISQQSTALQMFLKGELDQVALVADDMDTYRTSDFVVYRPEDFTTKITFNSSKEALKKNQEAAGANINMTMLAYKDFREAISLSIDRTKFAEQCTATHKAGYGLLNYNYVYDPDTGALYRDSDQAKQALCNVYGVSDESEITGFDKTKAAELYTKAYNDAIAAGDLKESDKVQIDFHMYQSDDSYKKIFNFIQDAIAEAAAGTPFEGKIEFKFIEDPDYYNSAKAGNFGIILSTWGGAAMNPWSVTECYASPVYLNEYGFDPFQEIELTVNGEKITRSYYDWFVALNGGDYTLADNETKLQILAGFEEAFLKTFVCTPLYYRTVASLLSRKVNYATDTYVNIVGFGGIPEMTYNYTDEEWAAYLAENNNQLTY